MRQFWYYLKSDDRPEVKRCKDSSWLAVPLPEHFSWPFHAGTRVPLTVAPSQEKAIAKVFREFMNRCLDKRENKVKKTVGALITAVPPIDNNASLNLLVHMASQFNVDVVIHRAKSFAFTLSANGSADDCELHKVDELKELKSKDTLYIFDPAGGNSDAVKSIAYTVTVSSEKQSHYKKLRKDMCNGKLWMSSKFVEDEVFVSTYDSRD